MTMECVEGRRINRAGWWGFVSDHYVTGWRKEHRRVEERRTVAGK